MIPHTKQPQWERKRFAGRRVIPNGGLTNEALTESCKILREVGAKQSIKSGKQRKGIHPSAVFHSSGYLLKGV